jgi:hypothetical protein
MRCNGSDSRKYVNGAVTSCCGVARAVAFFRSTKLSKPVRLQVSCARRMSRLKNSSQRYSKSSLYDDVRSSAQKSDLVAVYLFVTCFVDVEARSGCFRR